MAPPSRGPGATTVGILLLVLAGMLASLAVGSFWLRREVLDPERWTETAAVVASDPVVREDVATALATRIVEVARIEEQLSALLPFPLGAFSGAITEGATDLVGEATSWVVGTDAFAQVWEDANRLAWTEVLATLRDEGQLTSIDDGALTLDLQPTLELVRDRLAEAGVPAVDQLDLSAVDTSFVLIEAAELERLQWLVRAVDLGVIVFPSAAVVAAVAGFALSRRVGFGLVAMGLGVLVGAGTAGVVAERSRSVAIDAFRGGILGPEAVGRVLDAVTDGARQPLVAMAAIGVVLVVAGLLISARQGVSRAAVA